MITAANAFMQLDTDPGMRGRVMALYMMIFMGGTPLGAPLIGWIGEQCGARWTLVVGGALAIVGVLLAVAVYRPAGSAAPGCCAAPSEAPVPGARRGGEGRRLAGPTARRRFDRRSGAE